MPTVLITGANRGLGLEFARQYAADGWTVIAGCRRPDEAAELKATGAEVHAVDVAEPSEVGSFAGAVGGRALDLVIANAGVYGGGEQMRLGELNYDEWTRTLQVNLFGPVRIAEAFAANLMAGGGKLVAITSQMGSIADNNGMGGFLAYRSSKAGLNAAWKSIALELKPEGVTAMVMHPGWVATDMGGPSAPTTPEQSVTGMRKVIDSLRPDDAGTFRAFDGRTIPLVNPMTLALPDLKGRAAVVTGSTSGIGAALAGYLAQAGCDVMLNGLGEPVAIEAQRAKLEAECGVRVRHHPANMLKPDEIADLIASTQRAFGRLDILVNNAGVQHVAKIEDFPPEQYARIIDVNLNSVFHTVHHASKLMLEAGRGRIVNIASAHGLVASPFKSAYCASKFGVVGFTKSVALEFAEATAASGADLTCNAICPGYVKTPLVEGQIGDQARSRGISEDAVVRDVILATHPNKRFVQYEDLAGMMLYLVSDAGRSVNGAALSVDGGWTAR